MRIAITDTSLTDIEILLESSRATLGLGIRCTDRYTNYQLLAKVLYL